MSDKRPNIILLMTDDMGFSDLGCFGGEIGTPNLDRLGKKGVRFTNFYNCARCCSTRASILTGLYPHQAGIGAMVDWGETEAYRGRLNRNCVTLAEVLRSAGYVTCMSGKWHVGGEYKIGDPAQWRKEVGDERHPTPRQRGFDHFYGILCGACSYWKPTTLMKDDTFIESVPKDYYLTDALADEACGMISNASNAGKPFFLYWTPTTPHWPLHARPADIDKYRDRYRDGWDVMRQRRYDRQVRDGIIKPEWGLSPRDEKASAWDDESDKRWESLRMAVYAAQIDNLDQNVGKVLARLDALGIADNTLFFVLSDNGACAEFLREDASKDEWPGQYALPTAAGDKIVEVGNRKDLDPGPDGTFMSYDLSWANASNTPFRKFKTWTHEGGIATPLIMHWPAAMKGERIFHDTGHVIDIMPTILQAAGVEYPRQFADKQILPAEGVSLLNALTDVKHPPRPRELFWEHLRFKAVRSGDWKLVQPRNSKTWQLYDLSKDRTELNDVSGDHPDFVQPLVASWDAWAKRVGV